MMEHDKIKDMAEYIIMAAYAYAKGKDVTNNEAVNAMVAGTVAMAIGLRDGKTEIDDLKVNIINAFNGYFDSMREVNSL